MDEGGNRSSSNRTRTRAESPAPEEDESQPSKRIRRRPARFADEQPLHTHVRPKATGSRHTPVRARPVSSRHEVIKTCGIALDGPGSKVCQAQIRADQRVCDNHDLTIRVSLSEKDCGAALDHHTPTESDVKARQADYDKFLDSADLEQRFCAICEILCCHKETVLLSPAQFTELGILDRLKVPENFLPWIQERRTVRNIFRYPDTEKPWFNGKFLCHEGIEQGHLRLCNLCHSYFIRHRHEGVPPRSLARLWTGSKAVPSYISKLTLAEQLALSPVRMTRGTLYVERPLYNDPSTRQRATRGHWIAYHQYLEPVQHLPLSPKQLGEQLHVHLVNIYFEPDVAPLRGVLEVSPRRLSRAFKWLCKHNKLFQNITWNDAAASQYESTAVPSTLYVTQQSRNNDTEEANPSSEGPRPCAPPELEVPEECYDPIEFTETPESYIPPEFHEPEVIWTPADFDGHTEVPTWSDELEPPELSFPSEYDQTAESIPYAPSLFECDEVTFENDAESVGTMDPEEMVIDGSVLIDLEANDYSTSHLLNIALNKMQQTGDLYLVRDFEMSRDYAEDSLPSIFVLLYPYGVGGYKYSEKTVTGHMAVSEYFKHMLRRGPMHSSHPKVLHKGAGFATHQWVVGAFSNLWYRMEVNKRAWIRLKSDYGQARTEAAGKVRQRDWDQIMKVYNGEATYASLSGPVKALHDSVQVCLRNIPGTAAARKASLSEIFGLYVMFGTPVLFITISPPDLHSRLLLKFAGFEIDLQANDAGGFTAFQRARIAAENPVAAALYFDAIVRAVLATLIGDGSQKGVFGYAKAHYGTVETNGHGGLHLHFLVWLESFPSPDSFDAALNPDDGLDVMEIKRKICAYLDMTCRVDIDGQTHRSSKTDKSWTRDFPPAFYPRVLAEDPDYDAKMPEYLQKLVDANQWHDCRYNEKCAGGCISGYPRDKQPSTTVNDDGSYMLRRENQHVNPFNPSLIWAVGGNVDNQFLFLGLQSARATFYMTKARYATKSMTNQRTELEAAAEAIETHDRYAPTDESVEARGIRLSIRMANRLASMFNVAYSFLAFVLITGKDHYTSHEFVRVNLWAALGFLEDQNRPEEVSHPLPDPSASRRRFAVSAVSLDADGNIIKSSDCTNYILRGNDLEDVGYMQLFINFEYVKQNDSPPLTGIGGRWALRRSRFLNAHPHSETHMLRQRRVQAVPVILGRIPDPVNEPEEFAFVMLILYKPWRRYTDLKDSHSSNWAAYEAFLEQAGPEVCQAIKNSIYLKTMDREAKAELAKKATDDTNLRAAATAELRLDREQDFIAAPADAELEAEMRLNERAEAQANSSRIDQEHEAEVKALLKEFGTALNVPMPDTSPHFSLPCCFTDRPDKKTQFDLIERRRKELRNQEAELEQQRSPATSFLRANQGLTGSNSSGELPNPTHCYHSREFGLETFTNLVREKKLNREQVVALFVQVDAYLQRDQQPKVDATRLFVTGKGGVGKTAVIDAFKEWLGRTQRLHMNRIAAPTGGAGAQILGTTIHKLFNITAFNQEEKPVSLVTKLKREVTFNDVRSVIIDEVSMSGLEMHAQMWKVLTTVKPKIQDKERPYGNFDMFFYGDFYQLRCVRDIPLWCRPKKKQPRKYKGQLQIFIAWRDLTDIVILRTSMRHTGADIEFLATLDRLRLRSLRREDYDLLQTYCIGRDRSAADFVGATVITTRHHVRKRINRERAITTSRARKLPLYRYDCQYTCTNENQGQRRPFDWELASLRRLALHTHNNVESTLYMFEGMPAVITHNEYGDQGVTNGALCWVRKIIFDEREATEAMEAAPGTCYTLRYPPKAVLVQLKYAFPTLAPARSDGLPQYIIPLYTHSGTATIKIGDKHTRTFSFMQLSLTPAFAITVHKAQGMTMPWALVDPPKRGTNDDPASAYVMMSRVTTEKGLGILRMPEGGIEALNGEFDEDFVREIKRQELLSKQTIERVTERLNKLGLASKINRILADNGHALLGQHVSDELQEDVIEHGRARRQGDDVEMDGVTEEEGDVVESDIKDWMGDGCSESEDSEDEDSEDEDSEDEDSEDEDSEDEDSEDEDSVDENSY